jgi:hypothetical protein
VYGFLGYGFLYSKGHVVLFFSLLFSQFSGFYIFFGSRAPSTCRNIYWWLVIIFRCKCSCQMIFWFYHFWVMNSYVPKAMSCHFSLFSQFFVCFTHLPFQLGLSRKVLIGCKSIQRSRRRLRVFKSLASQNPSIPLNPL